MKKLLLSACLAMSTALPSFAEAPDIEALIKQMTLEEKFGQLSQSGDDTPKTMDLIKKGLMGTTLSQIGAKKTNDMQRLCLENSRLKIPLLFAYDTIHGYKTIFPVPLGEAASWSPADCELSAHIGAVESYAQGLRWLFAPMVDIARDPRWGRVVEGSGEDPFLGSALAAARVRGAQGPGPFNLTACSKHWVGYGAAEAGRDYNSTDISERALREVYFPPFKATVDAGVETFMSSFNDISGLPATANPFTLSQVLRNEWGFKGVVVSDYEAVNELINHGLAADGAEAAKYALEAGCDVEMVSRHYANFGPELVRSGKLSEKVVDESVRRVLRLKQKLGLWENPYTDEAMAARVTLTPESRAAARRGAARSFVLLKNEGGVLPLPAGGKVAVIGSLGDSQQDMLGGWAGQGDPKDTVTLLAALRERLGAANVLYSATDASVARGADRVVLCLGEPEKWTSEANSRAHLGLPKEQYGLLDAVRATGKPFAVVLFNGRPLPLEGVHDKCPAILEAWFPGTEAGHALADTLFGDANPGGKLPITFPRTLGQVPLYYNHKNTGRPAVNPSNHYESKYIDESNDPLYPFGHGLSYTTFTLSGLKVEPAQIPVGGTATVTCTLANTGARAGDEVVQLYIRDKAASVTRPVRELRGFERITLKPGETRTVSFKLGNKELGMYDRGLKWVVEPGQFDVWVGQSSVGGLQGKLEVR